MQLVKVRSWRGEGASQGRASMRVACGLRTSLSAARASARFKRCPCGFPSPFFARAFATSPARSPHPGQRFAYHLGAMTMLDSVAVFKERCDAFGVTEDEYERLKSSRWHIFLTNQALSSGSSRVLFW